MFGVGLVDDVITLKPSTKLIAQIALASVLLFFNYRLNWFESMTLDMACTLVWVVGLTNAFNLLDNMDGLCAGVALIAATSLALGLLQTATVDVGAPAEVRLLVILIGATGGFLVYNFHPGVDLHGRQRQPVAGLHDQRRRPSPRSPTTSPGPMSFRSLPRRSWSC